MSNTPTNGPSKTGKGVHQEHRICPTSGNHDPAVQRMLLGTGEFARCIVHKVQACVEHVEQVLISYQLLLHGGSH